MYKQQLFFALFLLLFCFISTPTLAAKDKRLQGVVNIETLVRSLDLDTFSDDHKDAETESLIRKRLEEAGWVPNKTGEFTIRIQNNMLSFRGDDSLKSFYILTFTRNILPERRSRPVATGSFLVTEEKLKSANYAKISGFGYIGRGSHTSGERFGLLPFNQDFIRLLARDKITSYIFTLTNVIPERSMRQRHYYELYLKCRFSDKTGDYIRQQANIKTSSRESPSSRRIMEYLLCVDVTGAFVYNSKTGHIIREWRIDHR